MAQGPASDVKAAIIAALEYATGLSAGTHAMASLTRHGRHASYGRVIARTETELSAAIAASDLISSAADTLIAQFDARYDPHA